MLDFLGLLLKARPLSSPAVSTPVHVSLRCLASRMSDLAAGKKAAAVQAINDYVKVRLIGILG